MTVGEANGDETTCKGRFKCLSGTWIFGTTNDDGVGCVDAVE